MSLQTEVLRSTFFNCVLHCASPDRVDGLGKGAVGHREDEEAGKVDILGHIAGGVVHMMLVTESAPEGKDFALGIGGASDAALACEGKSSAKSVLELALLLRWSSVHGPSCGWC